MLVGWTEKVMSFVASVLFGLVTGFVASKLVNSTGRAVLLDAALGMAGGVMGGLFFSWISAVPRADLNLGNVFASVCGAALVLFVFHAGFGQRPRVPPRTGDGDADARFSSQRPSVRVDRAPRARFSSQSPSRQAMLGR
jgi:uncharacterized membrane protein YeaQ/YmgE (transglycosylase-associated protein family)